MNFDLNQNVIIPDWPAPENVQALVTTRVNLDKQRDLSQILTGYDHFNLALHVQDDVKQVLNNRQHLADYLQISPQNFSWLEQVHGITVVEAETSLNKTVKADACTSTTSETVCTIMTADCLPVLFCNIPQENEAQQVAAAHAGWRGLADGILTKTLATFSQAQHVIAWLGPAISQNHFEVGQEVYDAFIKKNPENKKAFKTSPNTQPAKPKWLASLTELAKIELAQAGINAVYGGDFCTFEQSALFYSYRRDGARSGRMASLIVIREQ